MKGILITSTLALLAFSVPGIAQETPVKKKPAEAIPADTTAKGSGIQTRRHYSVKGFREKQLPAPESAGG